MTCRDLLTSSAPTARRWPRLTAILSTLSLALLFAQTGTYAQFAAAVSDPLPYSKGFLVTGDFVVGGVDFTPQANPADANGIATGTIAINGVPADADIVGAFLYWEAIFTPSPGMIPSSLVRFRGSSISPTAIKASSFLLQGNPATCWGAAGSSGARVAEFRADVLYLLPKRLDANDKWTGKYLVNGNHTVSLPEVNGNHAINSAGATLVIVYRDPSQPLRKIVLYDGAFAQPEGATVTQRLRAFYKSASTKSAKVTHIGGTGGNNQTEAVSFNGTVVSTTDPFPQTSPSSDRSWANPTYNVSSLMPGTTTTDGFGETATTAVSANVSPAACRTSAAIVFSTSVADVDGDGLPDGVEDAVNGLSDPPTASSPAGTPLPNLHAMGASSTHKDLFVEINAMWAPAGTTYGSANAPYSSSVTSVTDSVGHNHMPTPDVLKMIGDAYAAHGITPHFDVGDVTAYHGLGAAYTCDAVLHPECNADPYLVDSADARGGEAIKEQACSAASPNKVKCEFPAFPGTVGWKVGLQLYRDAPVGDHGEEITAAQATDTWKSGARRRRFDPIRMNYFHYVLYAHARGKPKSSLPCLNAGSPAPYGADGACGAPLSNNPDYHVPLSVSGVADLPGGNVLITLGLWEDFIGTTFVRASTTFHELGHNLNLWHGGVPAIWGDKTAGTATYVEPNCKPNYLSSMSYLFQVHGLFDNTGTIHLDYSGSAQSDLDETFLPDAPLGPAAPAYVPAWFAPAGSLLALNLDVPPARRFCNGAQFGVSPPASMARVYGSSTTAAVDWNGDAIVNAAAQQNVNFDGTADGVGIITTPLKGFNDWAGLRLDQIGAGRTETKFSDGDFLDLGSGDFLDFGSGDFLDLGSGDFLDFGSGDFLDLGSGDFLDLGSGDFLDLGSGDFLDLGSGDFLDFGSGDFLDFGSGDFLDFGSGDFLDLGSGSPSLELDYDRAREIGRAAAFGLNGCVINAAGCITVPKSDPTAGHVLLRWNAPPFGHVAIGGYKIFRKSGDASSTSPYSQIGTSSSTSFVDPNQLPTGKTFTYYVKTEFDDETPHKFSGKSNLLVITITNK